MRLAPTLGLHAGERGAASEVLLPLAGRVTTAMCHTLRLNRKKMLCAFAAVPSLKTIKKMQQGGRAVVKIAIAPHRCGREFLGEGNMTLFSPENPFVHGDCEVCSSPYKIYLRSVGGTRTRRLIPLHYCMECESFTCIGDYIENHDQLIADVDYNVRLLDNKVEDFGRLATFLRGVVGSCDHADVGCNIGVLVNACAKAGFRSAGYDLNKLAISKGRSLFPKIDLSAAAIGGDGRKFDLITMIDVLEHIKNPHAFLKLILPSLRPGGHLFIVVPRVDRDSWHFLSEPVAEEFHSRDISPFRDNDVHIVHYSSKGLCALGIRLGLSVVADHVAKDWPMNGIMLRK